jgi:hypothetical protein
MKNILSFSILLFLTSFTNVFAWGHKGHSLVAEVAFKYLDAKTKQNVLNYLNGMSIEEASNWMDEMRSDSKYDYMKPYHYVNYERGSAIKAIEGDNIINTLNQTLKDLDNIKFMSNEDIKLRLFYLFHLIGDLHQPLHVGYGEDKGGNTVQVSFFGRGSNLHKMWDSEIIEYKALTLEQVLKMNDFEPSEISAIKSINVLSWVTDSRSHLKSIYSFNNAKIDDRYVDANYPIVKMQILKAGLRLASVLEYYFKDVTYLASNKSDVITDETEVSVTIDVNKAKDNEGKLVYTCGKVYSTKVIKSNGMILMNVGGEYPNAPLTIVIYSDSLKNFDSAPEEFYKGKNICVGGKVKMYKGKPEIIINAKHAIQVK